MAKQNILIESKRRKASQLLKENRLEEAGHLYQEICARNGADVDAWIKSSEINRHIGQYAAAEEAGKKAVALDPKNAAAQYALAAVFHRQGNLQPAIKHYRAALSADAGMLNVQYLLAKALAHVGEVNEAERLFRRALGLNADFPPALSGLANLLVTKGEMDQAKPFVSRALELRPHDTEALGTLAHIAVLEKRDGDAIQIYDEALRLNPESPDILGSYASLLEQRHRLEEAREKVSLGLVISSNNARLNLAAATLARREQDFEECVRRCEIVLGAHPEPGIASETHMLLGQSLDRLGRYDEAFPHFQEGNRLNLVACGIDNVEALQQVYLDKIEWMKQALEHGIGQTTSQLSDEETPIFLIGFPRSGTTLLEQILDAHPALQSVEEQPMVERMMERVMEMIAEDPKAVQSLTELQIQELRAVYLNELAKHVQRKPGVMVIDKLPLNIISAPLIRRVFPNAKFILALRHPLDVCLSCFMQGFAMNAGMSHFTTLKDTTTLYLRVMGMWKYVTDFLPLNYHSIRYEDLVKDLDGQIRSLLNFLELTWEESIRQHREKSMRKSIGTPSYHQVTQPIYQRAVYRWEKYMKHFSLHSDAMAPYLKIFGYDSIEQSRETHGGETI